MVRNKQTVTLYINGNLYKTFKDECCKRALVVSKLLELYMQKQLKKWGVELTKSDRVV